MTKILVPALAVFFLSACAGKSVSPKLAATCEDQMHEALTHKKEFKEESQKKFWDAYQNSEAGKSIHAFNTKEACDFFRFAEAPEKYCENYSSESYTGCLKKYVQEKISRREGGATLLLLASAKHVNWTMSFRQREFKKKHPLFWSRKLADYSLFTVGMMDQRMTPLDIAGDDAQGRKMPVIYMQKVDRESAEKVSARFLEIVRKLVEKMEKSPHQSPEDKVVAAYYAHKLHAAALMKKARGLAGIPASR
jgi:hypothetical protein